MRQQRLMTYRPIINEEGISTWKVFITDEIDFDIEPDSKLLGCIVKLNPSVRKPDYVKIVFFHSTDSVSAVTNANRLTWVSLKEEELPKDLRLFIYLTKDTYND